jgi:hypothetical protein
MRPTRYLVDRRATVFVARSERRTLKTPISRVLPLFGDGRGLVEPSSFSE